MESAQRQHMRYASVGVFVPCLLVDIFPVAQQQRNDVVLGFQRQGGAMD